MKTRSILALTAATLVVGFAAGVAFTDDGPDEQEMWAQMMELGKPGPAHENLKPLAGTFTAHAKFWMDPSGEPMESDAKFESKWIFDGRFLVGEYEGDMAGMPFQGHWLLGHDNFKETYQNIWIDSMSSGISMMTGTASEDGKVITLKGTFECPMGKFGTRHVYTLVGPDEFHLDGFSSQGDKEWQEMAIVYKRAK